MCRPFSTSEPGIESTEPTRSRVHVVSAPVLPYWPVITEYIVLLMILSALRELDSALKGKDQF